MAKAKACGLPFLYESLFQFSFWSVLLKVAWKKSDWQDPKLVSRSVVNLHSFLRMKDEKKLKEKWVSKETFYRKIPFCSMTSLYIYILSHQLSCCRYRFPSCCLSNSSVLFSGGEKMEYNKVQSIMKHWISLLGSEWFWDDYRLIWCFIWWAEF